MKKTLSSAIWIIQTSSISKFTLSKKFTTFYMRHIESYLNTIIDKGKIDAETIREYLQMKYNYENKTY